MALTQQDELAAKMTLLRSHGITRDPEMMTHAADGPWYYQQIELGYNYRMTDLQAALGASQMHRLDEFVSARHQLAERYDRELADLPLITPWRDPAGYSSFHLYVIRLKLELIELTHRQVFEELRAAGIGVNLHYIPVHLQPYYKQLGFEPGMLPEAEAHYSEAISLPLFAQLGHSDQSRVIEALRNVLVPSPRPPSHTNQHAQS